MMENENSVQASESQADKPDSPHVYIPPPLIYLTIFLLSILAQNFFSLNGDWLKSSVAKIFGWSLIGLFLIVQFFSLCSFILSKNTVVTIKPASSLQTTGIYSISRNPMYAGLLLLYSGFGLLIANWWTIIFIPVVILIMQSYVIRREENYLRRTFGNAYDQYAKKVRRWI